MMGRSRSKSSLLGVMAILAAVDHFPAVAAAPDRAWVNDLQPGRIRTRANGEAQWKREQRRGRKR